MRLKADLLLFMVAIIWGTRIVTQGVAARWIVLEQTLSSIQIFGCVVIFVAV
jgi:hypothetical protein